MVVEQSSISEELQQLNDPLRAFTTLGGKDAITLRNAQLAKEFQGHSGKLMILDEAKALGDVILPDLQRAFDTLTSLGANVVILTTEDERKTPAGQVVRSEDYLNDQLALNGFGNPEEGTFDDNVIACLLDYGQGNVVCVVGENWIDIIDDTELVEIQTQILTQANYGGFENTQAGVRLGMEFFASEIEQSLTQTQQTQPVPGSSEQGYGPSAGDENEAVISVPGTPEGVAQPKVVLPLAVGSFLLVSVLTVAAGIYTYKERKWRKEKLLEISKQAEVLNQVREKFSQYIASNTPFDAYTTLLQLYETNYPEKVDEVDEQYEAFFAQLKKIDQLDLVITQTKIGTMSRRDAFPVVQQSYQELLRLIPELTTAIDGLVSQVEEMNQKIAQAESNLAQAEQMLQTTEQWILSQKDKYADFIPNPERIILGLQSEFSDAKACFEGDQKKLLLGSEKLAQLQDRHEQLKSVLEVMSVAVTTYWNSHADFINWTKPWEQEVGNTGEFLTSTRQLLTRAGADLESNKPAQVILETVNEVGSENLLALKFVTHLIAALDARNQRQKRVDEFINLGFRDTAVQPLKAKTAYNLSEAIKLAKAGNWSAATTALQLGLTLTEDAVVTMQNTKKLKESNDAAIQQLSHDVAATQRSLKDTTMPIWQKLQTYKSANYSEVADHITKIEALLAEIFDKPEDEYDLASIASRNNSMEEQRFTDAESVINAMHRELAVAKRLIDQVSAQYKLVETARAQHQQAILVAERHVAAVDHVKSIKEHDSYVSTDVDRQVENARKIIGNAKKNAEQELYVAALKDAAEASEIAIKAKEEAEQQIATIRALFTKLEQVRGSATNHSQLAARSVTDEADAVVSTETSELVRQMQSKLSDLVAAAQSLTRYEDKVLAQKLEQMVSELEQFSSYYVTPVNESLEKDQRKHRELLQQAETAISQARDAINSAESSVENARAGGVGRSLLRAAQDELPDQPAWGTVKSRIELVITQAISARQKAERAESAADEAIKQQLEKEERERRRREAEKREQERKERERQAAVERAQAEKRRQEQQRQDEIRQKQREQEAERARERDRQVRKAAEQRMGKPTGGLKPKR